VGKYKVYYLDPGRAGSPEMDLLPKDQPREVEVLSPPKVTEFNIELLPSEAPR
jgi:hypothetical protein